MKAKLISNIWKIFFTCTAILLFGSCTDEPFRSGNTDIEAGVKIFIKVPAPSVSQTRANTASDDDYYNGDGVYLLIFNGNENSSKLLQSVRASAGSDNTLYAKLKNNVDAKHVYIVANVESYIKDWGENTTLGKIKEELKMSLPQTKGVLTAIVTPQPMIGYAYLEKGIQESASIGTEQTPVYLTRSTAKISLYNQAENMKLEGVNLINAPIAGYLYESPDQLAGIGKAHSGKGGSIEEMLATASDSEQNCVLYTYESDDTKPTAVVIKTKYLGTTNFYRLDLNTKEVKYALKRNHNYIVTIKVVKKQGYATAEEAINNPAGNLEYDINVVDAYARDMVSNGQYYLGVSNTEFYALTDNSITSDEDICTISHNAPAGVVGRFEVPATTGGGIVLESTTFPDGTGAEQNITLRIKSLPADFSKGEINITLGNLTRTITVYKAEQPSKFGALLNNFIKKGYISGIVDVANQDWLKLTKISVEGELTEEEQYSRLEDSGEGIHIRVRANMGDDSSPKFRTGHIDLFRKDQIGNARVMIKQPVHDVYTDVQGQAKLSPYTYVGTFHRSNQTGERIIRVKADIAGNGTLRWRVRVLSGDFIRISAAQSRDGRVTRNFYGAGDNTTIFGQDVEQFQVEGGTTVIDNPTGTTDIYFRVGLNSTIAPSATRYGILGLFVGNDIDNNKVTRYIFVRQGEAADYLMRPQDPAEKEPSNGPLPPASVIMDSRPLAVKLSPFNLTDKRTPDNPRSILSKETPGTFADYPSQAGYLYQAITGRGWWADPSETPSVSQDEYNLTPNPLPDAWDNEYETCPEGYRPIGDTNGVGYGEASAEESPMRQSLWLYPKNGGISNTQNSIIGYIADGFYDRQPMWHTPSYKNPSIDQPTIVNKGSQTAYIGVLAFNPRTLASVFLPLAGYYVRMAQYQFNNAGYSGGFYTQSRTTGRYWTVDYGMMSSADPNDGTYSGVMFRVDNYATHSADQAANIRCVKK